MEIYKKESRGLEIMKRGISPLISWILIISFSIAIAMLVIPVFVDQAETISEHFFSENSNNVDYCNDVSVSIEQVCKRNGRLEMKIDNNGDYSLYKLTVGRVTNISALQWCEYDNISVIPSDGEDFYLNLDADYSLSADMDSLFDCNESEGSGSTTSAVKLEIIPWIKPDPEGDLIFCENRKLVIDDFSFLNNACYVVCTDDDGDGYVKESASSGCDYSAIANFQGYDDCDDNRANVYPGALEKCGNGLDDNCDGTDSVCSLCLKGNIIPDTGCNCTGTIYYGGWCCVDGFSPDPCGGIVPT